MSSVNEIAEKLKRAEEISKFLRQQSEFWMDQVDLIQKSNARQMAAAPGGVPGPLTGFGYLEQVAATWLQSPLLVPGGQFDDTGVASASTPSGAEQPRAQDQAVDASSGPSGAAAEAEVRQPTASASTSTTGLNPQMAELRRAQTEKWERARTASNASGTSPS